MGLYPLALDLSGLSSLFQGILGLGFLIFVHELGHFLVAKACGVKCEKFYVGFDPPFRYLPSALWKKKWGETEYGIGIIPLGGYVKMLGQDDNPGNAAREAERIRLAKEAGEMDASEADYVLDPRSYPAKSVPQRMAIISAGVIMNILFAVILATIAYKMGVNYIPCNIGTTMPGDPAWNAGLGPGDKIVQLGESEGTNEHLSFTQDLRFAVAATNGEKDLAMKVRRPSGDVETVIIKPSSSLKEETGGLPTIGVYAARTRKVSSVNAVADLNARILGNDPDTSSVVDASKLSPGDEVVAIEAGSQAYALDDDNAYKLDAILALHSDDELVFDVRNAVEGSELPAERKVTVAPFPMRELGITMEPGPVASIQPGSPAQVAGLEVGDTVVAVAGTAVLDPLRMDTYLLPYVGQPTVLSVRRGEQDIEISVTPVPPAFSNLNTFPDGPISAETIGAAFTISDQIQTTRENLSDSIQPGDTIEKASFTAREDSDLTETQILTLGLTTSLTFGEEGRHNWVNLMSVVQNLPAGIDVSLTVSRGVKQQIVELQPTPSPDWYSPRRNIDFMQMGDIRTATGFGEAIQLGLNETRSGVKLVFYTLKNIKRHYKHLGGPIMIAAVAKSEASEGLPRLLIFLCLLSTNLAVVNFLPIPVLDGGHMMFLLAEGIRGKPVNERWQFYLTMIGFSFILALMVFVIGMDLNRFLPGLSG